MSPGCRARDNKSGRGATVTSEKLTWTERTHSDGTPTTHHATGRHGQTYKIFFEDYYDVAHLEFVAQLDDERGGVPGLWTDSWRVS